MWALSQSPVGLCLPSPLSGSSSEEVPLWGSSTHRESPARIPACARTAPHLPLSLPNSFFGFLAETCRSRGSSSTGEPTRFPKSCKCRNISILLSPTTVTLLCLLSLQGASGLLRSSHPAHPRCLDQTPSSLCLSFHISKKRIRLATSEVAGGGTGGEISFY